MSVAWGEVCAEAAECCLEINHHSIPVVFAISGDQSDSAHVDWRVPNQASRDSWADLEEAAEFGAIAVAIVLTLKLTGIPRVRRSAKGPGIDFRMGICDDEQGLFQDTARLEISGILNGSAKVKARLSKKLTQLGKSDASQLPGYAAIIEFGLPETRIVKKWEREGRQ